MVLDDGDLPVEVILDVGQPLVEDLSDFGVKLDSIGLFEQFIIKLKSSRFKALSSLEFFTDLILHIAFDCNFFVILVSELGVVLN